MVPYFESITDDLGIVYSFDNLIAEWPCALQADQAFPILRDLFQACLPKWDPATGSRQGLPAASKYDYYSALLSGGGVAVYLGKWRHRDDGGWYEYPLLRVKVNPNKWWQSGLMQGVLAFIGTYCPAGSGQICKVDLAADLPCPPSSVLVSSQKTGHSFSGTRYYGRRHHAGYLKVYDKAVEADLSDPLTRCEWTICTNQPVSFDQVVWLRSGPSADLSGLSVTNRAFAQMAALLRAAAAVPSEEYDRIFQSLDRRKRAFLQPYFYGDGVSFLSGLAAALRDLSLRWCDLIGCSFSIAPSSSFSGFQIGQAAETFEDLDPVEDPAGEVLSGDQISL